MRVILVQQVCDVMLEGEEKLLASLKAEEKAKILARVHSAILLSLTDEVLREVIKKQLLRHYGEDWKASIRRNP